MTQIDRFSTTATPDEALPPVDGVIVRRGFAWLIDACILLVIAMILWVVVLIIGFLTFGLGWFLLPVLAVTTIMAYAAVTIGGSRQATPGMRMLDLVVTTPEGDAPAALNAAVHALLFYLIAPTFVLWFASLLIGFLRADARMGHDLLTNLRVGRFTRSGLA
jgi:uncharacterized RDD family membrane protein YckC